MKNKLTEIYERYGRMAVILYLVIFFVTLVSVWLLVQSGVKLQQISWFEDGLAGKAGTFTIAYIVTKILQPLRIGLVVLLLYFFGGKEKASELTSAAPTPGESQP